MASQLLYSKAIFRLPDLFINPRVRRERELSQAAFQFLTGTLPSHDIAARKGIGESDIPDVIVFIEDAENPDALITNLTLGVD